MSSSNDIWADMMAELQNVKAAAVDSRPIIDRLKVGDRIRLREGWFINRPDLIGKSSKTGTVAKVNRHWTLTDLMTESNMGVQEDDGDYWMTNHTFVEEIIS